MPRSEMVVMGDRKVAIEVAVVGDHPHVVLIPSAHRSADDFDRLASDLWEAGHGSVAVNMRGARGSAGATDGITMRDVADDVAGVIAETARRPVHVVGHALGNVFARATAAYRPDVVASVALLACGGHVASQLQLTPELLEHFERCGHEELPDAQRLESLQVIFFAPGNDPSVWLTGWWPDADVRTIFHTVDPEEWALAGQSNVLILQPLQDRLCAPEVGQDLCRRLGARGRYVEVPQCGHAILPEQPELIARELVAFIGEQEAAFRAAGPPT